MRRSILLGLIAVCASNALAAIEVYSGSVSFTSDAEPPKFINLASFNTMGGIRTLNSVLVEISHSGSVDIRGDNDDDFKTAVVNARMIRQNTTTGPGVFGFGNKTILGPNVSLAVDDGDDGVFDASPPDGVNFGTLNFPFEAVLGSPASPANALYATPAPNIVTFTVTPSLMVNDQQFSGPAPDQWQLEVQNPLMTVQVKVTYDYVPEPATLSLLGLGGLFLARRIRR